MIFKPLFLGGYMPTVSCLKVDPENENMPMTTESSIEPITTKSMEDESGSFLRYWSTDFLDYSKLLFYK